jgi:hypothetical protein
MDWPGRIYSLEQRVKAFARTLADVLARLARAETNIQQSQGGGGGGGSSPSTYFTHGDGVITSSDNTTAGSGSAVVWDIDDGSGALSGTASSITAWNLQYRVESSGTGGYMPCSVRKDASGDLVLVLPPVFLARTTTISTYPSVAGRCYAINPVYITGSESEGGFLTTAANSNVICYAFNIGANVPSPGQLITVVSSFNRLFFKYL